MKLYINTETDPFVGLIDGCEIYRTACGECHYIITEEHIIFTFGAAHNSVLSVVLQSKPKKIKYQTIDEVECLSLMTSKQELIIFSNENVHPSLARILHQHSGKITIVTPGQIHESGRPAFSVTPHPIGQVIDAIPLQDCTGEGVLRR